MELLTRNAVSDLLGVSLPTVARWIARKELPVIRIGKVVRIRLEDLESFLASHLDGSSKPTLVPEPSKSTKSKQNDGLSSGGSCAFRKEEEEYNNVSSLTEGAA